MAADQHKKCITKVCNGLILQNGSLNPCQITKETNARNSEHRKERTESPDETKGCEHIKKQSRDTENSGFSWYQTTLDKWPAYRIAARHLEDILLRSEYTLHHHETFSQDRNEWLRSRSKSIAMLSSTHVHIHCNKRIAETLKTKTKLIQKRNYKHKSYKPCVKFQVPKAAFSQSSIGSTKHHIHLNFTVRSIRLSKTVSEVNAWSECNDILERFAFAAARETLQLYQTPLMLMDAGLQEINEQFVQDIEALYERSMIPIEEKLRFHYRRTSIISQKVQRDLQDIEGVMAIQMTLARVVIWVDPSKDLNDLSSRIKTCVRKNSVEVPYTVIPFEVTPYSIYVCGDKIKAKDSEKYGTLGGFFLSEDGKDKYVVLSRHVAEKLGTSSVKIRENTIAHIPQLVHSFPDIALAKVLEPFMSQCVTEFKSEDGRVAKSRLCVMENRKLRGLHVFIWGATSTPGIGRIEEVEFSVRRFSHFIISDTSGDPFCQEGDSGAIVCSDERDGSVSLIAVVVGRMEDGKQSRYLVLSLKEGLKTLCEKYGVSFAMMR